MQLEVITARPQGAARPTPVLFVHGAWHGAWCWERFLPHFASHGYVAHALSLRGHAGSEGHAGLRWHSPAHDYVADVAAVVAELGRPPVLVGHSMGGYVVQKYLETRDAAAAILLAPVPVSGILGFVLRSLRRRPWPLLKAQIALDTWHIIGTPELAREAFFSPEISADELARHYARLQAESIRAELDMLALALPRPRRGPTPMLVLGAANDNIFSAAEVEATARAHAAELEIFPAMAHDMMLEPAWQAVADRIIAWLGARGL